MNRINLRSLHYGIIIPALLYLLIGLYLIIYPVLFDTSLYWIILLSIFSIVSSAGLFLFRRWGLWLAIIISPCLIVVSLATLLCSINFVGFAPNIPTELFNLSLIICIVFTILSVLFLVDGRKKLK